MGIDPFHLTIYQYERTSLSEHVIFLPCDVELHLPSQGCKSWHRADPTHPIISSPAATTIVGPGFDITYLYLQLITTLCCSASMRGKRSKQYKKLMNAYGHSFGFRAPYQVLMDSEIILDATKHKMDLVKGLEKCVHDTVKPSTAPSCRFPNP